MTRPFVPLQFLLTDLEKAAFKRACFLSNTTMTRELRKFVYAYCEHSRPLNEDVLKTWLTDYQKSILLESGDINRAEKNL